MLTEVAIMSNISQLPSSFAPYVCVMDRICIPRNILYTLKTASCVTTHLTHVMRLWQPSAVRSSSEPATRSCHRKEASTTSKVEAMNSYY